MNTLRTRTPTTLLALLAVPLLVALAPLGCKPRSDPSSAADTQAMPPAPTNRVDIPASVRQNLGITFARVERRHVTRTLRVPGRFELLPTALREYRAASSGTVELLVEQYQQVSEGTPLYRIDSPHWRELQRQLADAHAALDLARADAESIEPLLAAHESHHNEIQHAVSLWTERLTALEQLKAAGGARGDEIAAARAALASARASLAETLETEAELIAQRSQTTTRVQAASARLMLAYEEAAALSGISASDLQAQASSIASVPRWQTMRTIEIRARAPGIVDQLPIVSGTVIDQHALLLTTVQPDQVRFRAVGLQSDLPRLAHGQSATVVPSASPTDANARAAAEEDPAARFSGTLMLAPTADPERRTLDLILAPSPNSRIPSWARPGVSAFLEVVTSGSTTQELAIPLRCVARDGAAPIIFRRDPADPNKAIRVEADLGLDDGRWIVIKSGVAEGNEIVLDGVYQLMIATSGTITKGGHFHADGTFHEGDD